MPWEAVVKSSSREREGRDSLSFNSEVHDSFPFAGTTAYPVLRTSVTGLFLP